MKLLILGGTVFVGRHLAEAALARGHDVTLFNRGQHNPDLFPQAEKLRGDRDGDLSALQGRRWDAVIDTCGYVPRVVRASAELLADAVGHYTFISSISVYARFDKIDMDETSLVGKIDNEAEEQVTAESYGPLKALCEQAVEQALPGRTLNIRPGLIVGPFDPTDRFTCWPVRMARGGEVLVPGLPEEKLEFIDARDLAEWNIRMVEAGKTGVYNATGPNFPLKMGPFLDGCSAVAGSEANCIFVPGAFLKTHGVDPNAVSVWWMDPNDPETQGVWSIDCGKAIADGLTYRPLADTVRDTLAWDATRPAGEKRRFGLDPERERELLHAWRNQA